MGDQEIIESQTKVFTPRLEALIPRHWVLDGLDAAITRLKVACADEKQIAHDTTIALFEIGNWVHSSNEYSDRRIEDQSPVMNGFVFARNRTHHQFASAVYYDDVAGGWKWRPCNQIPEAPKTQPDTAGENDYSGNLAGLDLLAVIERVQAAVHAAL